MKLSIIVLISAVFVFILQACSSKSNDTGTTGTGSSAYLATLPEDMMLSSPTSRQTSRLSLMDTRGGSTSPSPTDTAEAKEADLVAIVSATSSASCKITLTLMNAGNANCYGPSVAYTNHPNDASSNSWPGGDLGIWENTNPGSTEACAPAQLNSRMAGVSSLVDVGMFTMAGMACAANTAGKALPAESSSIDLTTEMAGQVRIDSADLTIGTATLAREANVSGNSVYVYSFTGTVGTKTYTIRLKHISLDATDSTYNGKVSVKVADTAGPGSMKAASMAYSKSSTTSAKILLKSADYNSAVASPFVSGTDYSVNLASGWSGNGNYFLASFNPVTNAGQFSYAWQAGVGDSHSRTFNTILTGASATTLSGNSFFGYGPTLQAGAGSISGLICAWTGPDMSHVPIAEVQRQDITMTSGIFTPTSSKTTYDPVAGCDDTSGGSAMIMTWTTTSGASPRDASTTTKDLAPIADVTTFFGALPTAPTEVD